MQYFGAARRLLKAIEVGNLLELLLKDLQNLRRQKTWCGPCLKFGIPDYYERACPNCRELRLRLLRQQR